jgi:hypothetical protein
MGAARTDNQDLFQYDTLIVNQLNRIEDQIAKFAIQNYASSGAVLFAFFTTKIPLLAAFFAVLTLNINFILAIAHNHWRFRMLYAMHDITRNTWFEYKPKGALFQALKDDQQSNQIVTIRTASAGDRRRQFDFNHPAIVSNFLPAAAAYLLLVLDMWNAASVKAGPAR